MNISQEEYIALLEDGRKHNKVLGQIEALESAIAAMSLIDAEYERDGTVDEFKVSQRMVAEVVALKAVILQSHFKN